MQKKNSKKRKRSEFEEDEIENDMGDKPTIIEQFDHEHELEEFYQGEGTKKSIDLS